MTETPVGKMTETETVLFPATNVVNNVVAETFHMKAPGGVDVVFA